MSTPEATRTARELIQFTKAKAAEARAAQASRESMAAVYRDAGGRGTVVPALPVVD